MGIMGGMLILANTITNPLFKRNRTARKMAATNWKPQMGIIPIKIPNATETDFLRSDWRDQKVHPQIPPSIYVSGINSQQIPRFDINKTNEYQNSVEYADPGEVNKGSEM